MNLGKKIFLLPLFSGISYLIFLMSESLFNTLILSSLKRFSVIVYYNDNQLNYLFQ